MERTVDRRLSQRRAPQLDRNSPEQSGLQQLSKITESYSRVTQVSRRVIAGSRAARPEGTRSKTVGPAVCLHRLNVAGHDQQQRSTARQLIRCQTMKLHHFRRQFRPRYNSSPHSISHPIKKQINDIATLPSVLLRSCLAGSKRISQCRILGPPSTRSRAAQAFVTVFVTL